MTLSDADIRFAENPQVGNAALNALFAGAWEDHADRDFLPVLARSLVFIGAYRGDEIVGFVNVAWDGGVHAFLLDTTVDPALQRRGIGVALVRRAVAVCARRGIEWLHVDYEPRLEPFYRAAGFGPAGGAGLLRPGVEPARADAPRDAGGPSGSGGPLDGRRFRVVATAAAGETSAATLFEYHQDGEAVWAEYAGGAVRRGFLVGTMRDGALDFRYTQLNEGGETATGHCVSRVVALPNGRLRLEETWEWESRDGHGTSVVEEVGRGAR